MRAGADGFECDLRLSADGHVVVFHDDDLNRLCGEKGSIEQLTLQDIKALKVLSQEAIPTLEELLQTFHTTRINLEIKKSSRDAVVVEQVLRILTKQRPKGPILFSSFSLEVMQALSVMDAERTLGDHGMLVSTSHIADLPRISQKFSCDTWNVPRQILSAPWSKRWRDVCVPPLWIWTLDEPDQWQSVMDSSLPFEAIITNKPNALAEYLSKTSSS
jgi:glycerophosphoryl diester phosphodiesterase